MTASDKSPAAFRAISEAADELDVPQHVLRFWETKFAQLKPMKRAGGRRLYRPEDMALLRGIRAYLQDDAYTIKGVQKLLKEQGIAFVRRRGGADADLALPAPVEAPSAPRVAAAPAPAAADAGPLFSSASAAPARDFSALSKTLARLQAAKAKLDAVLA
jgi:DNA-binding transcriptional MerR regulator